MSQHVWFCAVGHGKWNFFYIYIVTVQKWHLKIFRMNISSRGTTFSLCLCFPFLLIFTSQSVFFIYLFSLLFFAFTWPLAYPNLTLCILQSGNDVTSVSVCVLNFRYTSKKPPTKEVSLQKLCTPNVFIVISNHMTTFEFLKNDWRLWLILFMKSLDQKMLTPYRFAARAHYEFYVDSTGNPFYTCLNFS